MDRYWKSNVSASGPIVPATNPGGYPSDGSASAGIDGTLPGAWWCHSVTEKIRNAILGLGGVPDWSVGSRVLNSAPASGQPEGWICTSTGTPGTWKSLANIQ
ncbi:hypothetical protein H3V53_17520 [Paraburkholderia bengalensis]|uniref:Carbohydrate binding domain-containing protein n=1 Tax=Paraburkholderia bengalensis TaxID=2747562 RepID=A0ABU8ITH8_9BURK